MSGQSEFNHEGVRGLRSRFASDWERLIAVKARDEEDERLGRLFNTQMVISLGVCILLSSVFLLTYPLGLSSAQVSWVSACFPLFFIPLAIFCISNAKRGHIRPMIRLYVWIDFVAIGVAAGVFDGIRSPAWLIFAWNITIAGILLAPAYALLLTGGVLIYFLLLALLTGWNLYVPPLSFGAEGREFADIAIVLIVLAFNVGLLTFQNMRSLRDALEKLRSEVAARKRTEENLRQSEERYRSVINNAGDIIFTMSSEGNYLSLNPAFEKISGWPVQQWVGQSFAPLVPPADLQLAFDILQKTLREEEVGTFELSVRKKNGDHFTGEFTITPLKQGDSVILLGICRDVTERKQIEETLAESEQKYRAIFDTAPDAIITTDLEGKITTLNSAVEKIIGWTPAEFLNTSYAQWVHEEDLDRANVAFQKIVAGQVEEVEIRLKCKSGGYRLLDVTAAPRVAHGKLAGALGFFRDITQRKRMEDEIRKLNDELEVKVRDRTRQLLEAQEELVRKEKLAVLGQVAGSVGHELRNPLGVMNNAAYFLLNTLSDADETTREYLNIIKDEIIRSERIVSDLLDSVRTQPPCPETVDVAQLIEQTVSKLVIPAFVNVKREIRETIPPLRVDAMQICQVIRNLIENGVDAMPEGGTLEIRAVDNTPDGTVTVCVRDSGAGMTPEKKDKLFQPLFTTKARGIGLGLVVVKNLTEANGGKVEVQSEPGKGSEFRIILPAAR